jgi:hypothetical protein
MEDLTLQIPSQIVWLFFILTFTVCLTLANRFALWIWQHDEDQNNWWRSFYHATVSVAVTCLFKMLID